MSVSVLAVVTMLAFLVPVPLLAWLDRPRRTGRRQGRGPAGNSARRTGGAASSAGGSGVPLHRPPPSGL
jgi:hypothetical protein